MFRQVARTTAFAAAALLSGCASAPRPVPTPSNAVVHESRSAPDSSAAFHHGAVSWWSALGAPELDTLVAEAWRANPNLQAAGARLEAAAAQARIAGASKLPSASLGARTARQKQVFVGLPIPGAAGPVSSESTSYGVSLDASWELDLWGRIGAGTSAAVADRQAAGAAYAGARLSLAAQTARVWFALVEASRQVDLARATVENYETTLSRTRERYRRGLVPSLDLRLTSVDLASARDRLAQREQILDATRRQLEILLGRYPAGLVNAEYDLPGVIPGVPEGLPSDLVSRRPDLVVSERRLASSRMRIKEARLAQLPRISLTGSYGRSSGDLSDLLDGNFAVWSLVGNLIQPIFQGGRLRANVALARARGAEALALYVNDVLTAYGEVERALAADSFLRVREEQVQIASDQASAGRRLAEDRYARGLTDLITMLTSQRADWQAASQLLSIRRMRLEARVDLHLALGGGFESRDDILSAADPTGEPTTAPATIIKTGDSDG